MNPINPARVQVFGIFNGQKVPCGILKVAKRDAAFEKTLEAWKNSGYETVVSDISYDQYMDWRF